MRLPKTLNNIRGWDNRRENLIRNCVWPKHDLGVVATARLPGQGSWLAAQLPCTPYPERTTRADFHRVENGSSRTKTTREGGASGSSAFILANPHLTQLDNCSFEVASRP